MTSNTIKDNLNSPNVDVSLKKGGLNRAEIKLLADLQANENLSKYQYPTFKRVIIKWM